MVIDHVEHEITLAAPIQRVWEALTRPQELAQWFGEAADFRRGPERELEFHWDAHGTYHALIEREESPKRFAWRWALAPDVQPAIGNSTLAEFSLTDLSGSAGSGGDPGITRLAVLESGFESLDQTEGQKLAALNDNMAGWVGGFLALKQYLEGYEESEVLIDPGAAI